MRRALALLVPAAIVAVVLAGAGGKDASYRVDAIFSNAAGLIPGQNVQIAGAVVGKVAGIKLTPDHRARVQMQVQTGFAPFHSDARCEIKPQSLIGEKFVACDPGTADAKQLAERGGAPAVPLARTSAPVDIDLIFAALRRPYTQRLSLIVNELGTGLAGRPHDLQLAIKRAAPALQESDRVLKIVNSDRALLGRLIERSDNVLAKVTPRSRDVTRFVESAGRVSTEVAQRRDALGTAIDRLPPLLAELEPSAASLASVSRDSRPVVHELSQATPSLRALFSDLAPLTDSGRPALRALRSASDEGRKAVKVARPIAAKLQPAAQLIPHVAAVTRDVTGSLKSTGGVERLQEFVWLAAAATGRFDSTSHIVPSYQIAGLCQKYATTPVAECSAHWPGFKAAPAKLTAKKHRKHRRARHRRQTDQAAPEQQAAPESPSTPPSVIPKLPDLPPLPKLPGVTPPQLPSLDKRGDDTTEKLLDFLMGR